MKQAEDVITSAFLRIITVETSSQIIAVYIASPQSSFFTLTFYCSKVDENYI